MEVFHPAGGLDSADGRREVACCWNLMPLVEGDFEQNQEEEDEEHSLEARQHQAVPVQDVQEVSPVERLR